MPGPRTEELAALAGLSADHDSRLEQGRQQNVTDEVVRALSRALQLDDVEREHLRDPAAPASRRRRAGPEAPQQPDPGMLRLMGALEHVPALLLGRRAEVLARNGLLGAVLGADLPPGSPFVRWLFLDPDARVRITNWSDVAASAVGALRHETGRRPDDRRLADLVAELRRGDRDVDRWWLDQRVTFRTSLTEHLAPRSRGRSASASSPSWGRTTPTSGWSSTPSNPDSPTARVLPLLAGWGCAGGRASDRASDRAGDRAGAPRGGAS